MHVFKGNVGSGMFALGDAFRNGGLILGPVLALALGIICVHCQHVLLQCSKRMRNRTNSVQYPDFAETVGLCVENGPRATHRFANVMRVCVNWFLCVTQLGFCCVYFVFVTNNIAQIWDQYDINMSKHWTMTIILVPILLSSLITNLKYLALCSTLASACMLTGSAITLYFCTQDLPDIRERPFVGQLGDMPLFFGTAIFAFEGISLVLPLQSAMQVPRNFHKRLGVLNVGMTIVTMLFLSVGFLGFLKYGDAVSVGSLTLNIPGDNPLAQSVKLIIATGVLLGYALQLYVAIQIMWPNVVARFGLKRHLLLYELLLRTIVVFITCKWHQRY